MRAEGLTDGVHERHEDGVSHIEAALARPVTCECELRAQVTLVVKLQRKVCTTVVDTPDTMSSIKKKDHRAAVRAAGAGSLRAMYLTAAGVHISVTAPSGATVLRTSRS